MRQRPYGIWVIYSDNLHEKSIVCRMYEKFQYFF